MNTINITINVNVLPTATDAPDGRDALRAAIEEMGNVSLTLVP